MGKTEVELVNKINDLEKNNIIQYHNYNKKIVFFVKHGMDSFLGEVVDNISKEYNVLKIIVNDYREIDLGMNWADICWFEWCDDLMIYGSNLDVAKDKTIICRLHSYEAFTDYVYKVKWSVVDKVIFISESIRDYVIESVKEIDKRIASVIPNGINLDKWTYSKHKRGFNIAYVGYINYKKGPMLLLHAFKAIYDTDNRYMLYIAGKFQDDRDVLYFEQMIKEFGLENNIIFEGWQDNLDDWLEDKNYIICTSILESQNMSVMQAMAKGIKPLIHNFVGARKIYNENYIWSSIDQVLEVVNDSRYESKQYRNFIYENYSIESQINAINKVLIEIHTKLVKENSLTLDGPYVTVGILNYNYSHYLDQALLSVLNQTYKNIEIIIVDDNSTDGSIDKIKNYEKKYKNITGIYHKQNSGNIVKGLREIIKIAKSKYAFFLSADDFIKDKFVIQKLINQLIVYDDVDYIYGDLEIVDAEGKNKGKWVYGQFDDNQIVRHTFSEMGSGLMPMTIGIYNLDFYRKNNITWYHEDSNILSGDVLNSLFNIKYGWKYKYIPLTSVCYRHHTSNMTYNLKDRIPSLISVIEFIINNFDEKLYMPQNDYLVFNDSQKNKSYKMYKIAEFYFNMLNYYKNGFKPWDCSELTFSSKQISDEVITPLTAMVNKYCKESLNVGNFFEKEIRSINEKIEDIKSVMK